MLPVTADDPAQPGDYEFHTFTYGSGKDLQRKAYGKDVLLASASVDATEYISSWPVLRTLFWGSIPLPSR